LEKNDGCSGTLYLSRGSVVKYIIRSVSRHEQKPYYLKQVGDRHHWHMGERGRELARRFDSQAEAQALIDVGYIGCAGGTAEIIGDKA
jgi:hypothetical protein